MVVAWIKFEATSEITCVLNAIDAIKSENSLDWPKRTPTSWEIDTFSPDLIKSHLKTRGFSTIISAERMSAGINTCAIYAKLNVAPIEKKKITRKKIVTYFVGARTSFRNDSSSK